MVLAASIIIKIELNPDILAVLLRFEACYEPTVQLE